MPGQRIGQSRLKKKERLKGRAGRESVVCSYYYRGDAHGWSSFSDRVADGPSSAYDVWNWKSAGNLLTARTRNEGRRIQPLLLNAFIHGRICLPLIPLGRVFSKKCVDDTL